MRDPFARYDQWKTASPPEYDDDLESQWCPHCKCDTNDCAQPDEHGPDWVTYDEKEEQEAANHAEAPYADRALDGVPDEMDFDDLYDATHPTDPDGDGGARAFGFWPGHKNPKPH